MHLREGQRLRLFRTPRSKAVEFAMEESFCAIVLQLGGRVKQHISKDQAFGQQACQTILKILSTNPKADVHKRYRISPWRTSSWKIYLCAMSISSHSSKNPLFCTQSHHTPRHCWCRHAGAHTYKAQICRRTQPPPFSVTRTSHLSVCTFTLNIHTLCSSHKQQ